MQDIAKAINTGTVPEGTARFDTAAAKLTESLHDEAETPKKQGRRARGPKMALHLGGKPQDEQADSAAQPFETTEIPPLHRHEYERAEDAPSCAVNWRSRCCIIPVLR